MNRNNSGYKTGCLAVSECPSCTLIIIFPVDKLESILQFKHLQYLDALQKWYKPTLSLFWDNLETQKLSDNIILSFSWFKCMQMPDSSFKTMLFITVFKEESFLKWNHAEEYLMRNSKKTLTLISSWICTNFWMRFYISSCCQFFAKKSAIRSLLHFDFFQKELRF